MITMKTADKLARMAREAGAISDAVYEVDKQSSDSIRAAAAHLAAASTRLSEQLQRYSASVAADTRNEYGE